MIDYQIFQKSLKHLQLQHDNLKTGIAGLPELMREAVKESVIQRFETCYDCLWKTLKRYLVEELGIPEVPASPKPVLRLAHENALLASPIENWLRYADARTATAHDYSGEKAADCLEMMDGFIHDAIQLYETVTGAKWT